MLKVYGACPRDQHLSGSKVSKIRSREELSGIAVTTEASTDPTGSSGAGMVLQFPALSQGKLTLLPSAATAGYCPWVRQLPWAEDHSWRGTPLRAVSSRQQQSPQLGH